MRHCLLAGLLLFSAVLSLNALTLDEVMDRHIEALGGLDNIRNITSARTVATVKTAGMEGELTISYVYPDKIRNDIVLPMAKLIQAAGGDNIKFIIFSDADSVFGFHQIINLYQINNFRRIIHVLAFIVDPVF